MPTHLQTRQSDPEQDYNTGIFFSFLLIETKEINMSLETPIIPLSSKFITFYGHTVPEIALAVTEESITTLPAESCTLVSSRLSS